MLQLIEPRHVRLRHISINTEKHGKRDVDRLDVDLVVEGPNHEVLSLLDDRLLDALYHDPDGGDQPPLDGVPRHPSKARFPRMGAFPWTSQGSGMDLTIYWGLDDEAPIRFFGGKAKTKSAVANDGGLSMVAVQFSTTEIPDGAIDKLRKKLKQMVEVTLIQQERVRTEAVEKQEPIDGTRGPDAGDLFAAEHGGPEDGADSEGGEADAEAEETS